MNEVTIEMDEKIDGNGSFIIKHEKQQVGEMTFSLTDHEISVDHTEVEPEFEGKGLAKKMFLKMIEYAREKKLKVVATCSYVQKQIEKNKEEYADVIK